jgi:hypothetical protein
VPVIVGMRMNFKASLVILLHFLERYFSYRGFGRQRERRTDRQTCRRLRMNLTDNVFHVKESAETGG